MTKLTTARFTDSVEEALKQYGDPAWLGANSPLASPYFLAERLTAGDQTASGRGRVLQALLREATGQITGKYHERYQTLLREYYFQGRSMAAVSDQLGLTKNPFNLSRNAAIAAVAENLIDLVHPALHLEQPPFVPPLLDRQPLIADALAHLRQRQTVALLGTSGMGKTALASRLAQELGAPLFWRPTRPGLNDQVEHLLFALGLFVYQQGEPALWLELVASQGKTELEKLLGLLRYGLTQMDPAPLLCFDDLHLLQPVTNPAHAALLALLQSLRGQVPLLITGQESRIEADQYVTLNGLSPASMARLFAQQELQLAPEQVTELHHLTQGNPRLLELCQTVLLAGTPLDQLWPKLLASPTLDMMLIRILQGLTTTELTVLLALCVYRSPAPAQHWANTQSAVALRRLVDKRLLQLDQAGGVEVPLAYRRLLYQQLSADQRRSFHHEAANVRSKHGAYTAAAYHLSQAGAPAAALALWHEQQEREIAQGQAAAALTLFRQFANLALPPLVHEQRALICARLEYLAGHTSQAQADLRILLQRTTPLAVEANELAGMIANDQSEFADAASAFQQALLLAERTVEVRAARAHKGLAWLHLRQQEMEQVERELNLAEYEIENMRGNLAMDRYQYTQARQHYQQALQVAETLGYVEGQAKTHNNLATLLWYHGHFGESLAAAEAAYRAFAGVGKIANQAGCRLTQAVAYNQAGDHHAALLAVQDAQTILTKHGEIMPWQQALIDQALAEAHLGLGNLAVAEVHAQQVIASEEADVLADAWRVLGEIRAERQEWIAAEHFVRLAINLATEREDRYLAAYAWRAQGRIYQQQGQQSSADDAFAIALAEFQAIDLSHEVARTQQAMIICSSAESVTLSPTILNAPGTQLPARPGFAPVSLG